MSARYSRQTGTRPLSSMAYDVYIRDHYVHDLNLSDLSPRCSAQSPAMQTMMHQRRMISNKRIGHSVAVDWTYTPAQAAAANASSSDRGSSLRRQRATHWRTLHLLLDLRRCRNRHLSHGRLPDDAPGETPAERGSLSRPIDSRSFLCVPDAEGLQL